MRSSGISSSAPQALAKAGYWFFTGLLSNGADFSSIRDNPVTDFLPIPPKAQAHQPLQDREVQARDAARRLEVTFLAEMLKSAGFGEQPNTFTGSAGEDHFASFHREAIAERMVDRGGIGLTEHFFRAMMERYDDT